MRETLKYYRPKQKEKNGLKTRGIPKYVVMEYEGNWRIPVRTIIKRLKEKYGLAWLWHQLV